MEDEGRENVKTGGREMIDIIRKFNLTPIPWDTEQDGDRIAEPYYVSHTPSEGAIEYICELGVHCTSEDLTREQNNASLIAAAPDLLVALLPFILTHSHLSMPMDTVCQCMGCEGKRAIIKASGRSWQYIKEMMEEKR